MNLDYYFPTPIWWEDTNIDNSVLESLCYKLRDEDPKGRSISNNGGWQSKDFKFDTYSELENLSTTILNMSAQCIDDYGFYKDSYMFEGLNMWFNINNVGDSNQIHTHSGSFISGVYYVKADKNQSEIVFYKNFTEDHIIASAGDVERYTPISGATCRYPPRPGRLILFPSYVPHGVMPSTVDADRISIAFNLRIKNV